MKNAKYFVIIDPYEKECYDIYACHKDTPIPTIKEVVERYKLSHYCLNSTVKEISMRKFLRLHHKLFKSFADSANDLMEWSPNGGQLNTWRWWHSAEDWEWIKE
jgi:hypothetical protein